MTGLTKPQHGRDRPGSTSKAIAHSCARDPESPEFQQRQVSTGRPEKRRQFLPVYLAKTYGIPTEAANRSVTAVVRLEEHARGDALDRSAMKKPSLRRWPLLATYCQARVKAPTPLGGVNAWAATAEGRETSSRGDDKRGGQARAHEQQPRSLGLPDVLVVPEPPPCRSPPAASARWASSSHAARWSLAPGGLRSS